MHEEALLDAVTGWQQAKGFPKDLKPIPGMSRRKDGIRTCFDHKQYWSAQPPAGGP